MIYCNKEQDYGNRAVYSFGATVDDMTGEIVFFVDQPPEITREPKQYYVTMNWVLKLFGKYKADFRTGIFKDYLAFYVISEDEKRVCIVRFLHSRQNWTAILRHGFSFE